MAHARNSKIFKEIHGIATAPECMKIHQNPYKIIGLPPMSHARNSRIFKEIHGIAIAPEYMKIHQNQ